MDTANKFMVAVQGESIVFLKPLPQKISKDDAINLASWIAALSDDNAIDDGSKFQDTLQEIFYS